MNPLCRTGLVWLFFLLPCVSLYAGRTKTVNKEYYANGRIKAVVITVVTTPRNADIFNYYKKTKISRTEFDSIISRKVKETIRITKLGKGGRPCYEVFYKEVDYDKNGKRTHFQKSDCDKSKDKIKEYKNGKVVFIHEKRRRKWLRW